MTQQDKPLMPTLLTREMAAYLADTVEKIRGFEKSHIAALEALASGATEVRAVVQEPQQPVAHDGEEVFKLHESHPRLLLVRTGPRENNWRVIDAFASAAQPAAPVDGLLREARDTLRYVFNNQQRGGVVNAPSVKHTLAKLDAALAAHTPANSGGKHRG